VLDGIRKEKDHHEVRGGGAPNQEKKDRSGHGTKKVKRERRLRHTKIPTGTGREG